MSKSFLIIGNWKMNTSVGEAEVLVEEISESVIGLKTKVSICPPAVFLEQCCLLKKELKSKLNLGIQNISWEESGAITGDISIVMVKDWIDDVLVGHSERRQYFSETNVLINKKIKLALKYGKRPVLCVGEKRFLSGSVVDVGRDMLEGMVGLTQEDIKKMVIAYEPVWAIGSGMSANPDYVNRVIRDLRVWLKDEYGFDTAETVKILYGGSVNAKNAKDYLNQKQVDGLLVGGASLKSNVFVKIIKDAEKIITN